MPRGSSETETELLLSVAVGQAKPTLRHELTKRVREEGTFTSVESFLPKASLVGAEVAIRRALDLGLDLWPLTSPRYPRFLKEIDSPPAVLFASTRSSSYEIPESAISIVGARAAPLGVCQSATRLSTQLSEAGVTIVSGLALGIDAAAHRGALQANNAVCPTIAVMAHGLDTIYPPSHVSLARQIVDAGGLLISEYAPDVKPMKHHFLARNRIVAGLSRGVVVIQAGSRSGSLVTARFAADYGRDVFVLRGAQDDEGCSGGEDLISQGATPIVGACEILAEYGLLRADQAAWLNAQWCSDSLEEFISKTNLSNGEILRLEILGVIERLPGNQVRYVKDVVSAVGSA